MKYVNKEYGFEGRPPFFNEFYEEKYKGRSISKSNFPKKPIIGVGLEYSTPNGAMIVGTSGSMWGIRVSYQKNGRWYDREDFLSDVGRLYTSGVDGDFTYFAHGNVTTTWVRYNQNSIALSVSAVSYSAVRIKMYAVKPCTASFKANESEVKGSAPAFAVIQGSTELIDGISVFKDRYDVFLEDDAKKREFFIAKTYTKPNRVLSDKNGEIIYEYDLKNTDKSRVLIFAEVGDDKILTSEKPTADELVAGISLAEIDFSNTTAKGSGVGSAIGNAFNSVAWHKHYNPYFLSCAYFPSRELNEYYPYDGYDMNVSTLLGSYFSDINLASNTLQYTFQDDILAVFTVWSIFCRTRDKTWLKNMYDLLKKEYVPCSKLVISDLAKDVLGQRLELMPICNSQNNEYFYRLDLNCIKLLNLELLEKIAIVLHDRVMDKYQKAKIELKNSINDKLFNQELGIYMDKNLGGEFVKTLTYSSFYPLFTCLIEDSAVLDKMIKYLLSKRRFGGEFMLSTLSKDNLEYGRKYRDVKSGEIGQPYSNYRGEIIPVVNYLVYRGLVRQGLAGIAGEFSQKCVNLYNKHCARGKYNIFDRYLPNKYVPSWAQKNHVSGNLLALCGLSELIDVEYFKDEIKPSISFGTMLKGEHSATNISLLGRNCSITVSDKQTCLYMDDKACFIAEGGKFEVRNFTENENGCEFLINAESNMLITLIFPVLYKREIESKIVFSVEKGVRKVKIDGEYVTTEKI